MTIERQRVLLLHTAASRENNVLLHRFAGFHLCERNHVGVLRFDRVSAVFRVAVWLLVGGTRHAGTFVLSIPIRRFELFPAASLDDTECGSLRRQREGEHIGSVVAGIILLSEHQCCCV
mmetsp:Transcript_32102/g.73799  ORF Transcript_32102/g.73799 Transcript_32102/m.73799 type:complete len:119 (+) Transcript_32102:528-884(+)